MEHHRIDHLPPNFIRDNFLHCIEIDYNNICGLLRISDHQDEDKLFQGMEAIQRSTSFIERIKNFFYHLINDDVTPKNNRLYAFTGIIKCKHNTQKARLKTKLANNFITQAIHCKFDDENTAINYLYKNLNLRNRMEHNYCYYGLIEDGTLVIICHEFFVKIVEDSREKLFENFRSEIENIWNKFEQTYENIKKIDKLSGNYLTLCKISNEYFFLRLPIIPSIENENISNTYLLDDDSDDVQIFLDDKNIEIVKNTANQLCFLKTNLNTTIHSAMDLISNVSNIDFRTGTGDYIISNHAFEKRLIIIEPLYKILILYFEYGTFGEFVKETEQTISDISVKYRQIIEKWNSITDKDYYKENSINNIECWYDKLICHRDTINHFIFSRNDIESINRTISSNLGEWILFRENNIYVKRYIRFFTNLSEIYRDNNSDNSDNSNKLKIIGVFMGLMNNYLNMEYFNFNRHQQDLLIENTSLNEAKLGDYLLYLKSLARYDKYHTILNIFKNIDAGIDNIHKLSICECKVFSVYLIYLIESGDVNIDDIVLKINNIAGDTLEYTVKIIDKLLTYRKYGNKEDIDDLIKRLVDNNISNIIQVIKNGDIDFDILENFIKRLNNKQDVINSILAIDYYDICTELGRNFYKNLRNAGDLQTVN